MRKLNLLVCCLVLPTLLLGPAARLHAEPAPASASSAGPSKQEAAKAHYRRGAQLYEQADYANAWLEFTSAYQLVPRPELLFNMGRCEVRLGRHTDAVQHLKAYLEARPNDPDAPGIRAEIADMQVQADEAKRRDAAEKQAPEPVPPPRRPFPLYGTIAGGASLVLLVASIATLGSVSAQYGTLQSSCAPNCPSSDVDPLRHQATAGYVLLGLGLAGAGAAAVLLTLELRKPPRDRVVRLSSLLAPPVPLSDGPLSLSWRF